MNCVLMIYCIISLLMKQTTLNDKLDTDSFDTNAKLDRVFNQNKGFDTKLIILKT